MRPGSDFEKGWGARNRPAAPPRRKESDEVVHLTWMPLGRLPLEVFRSRSTGRRPQERLGTHWPGISPGFPEDELESVSEEREFRVSLLKPLPLLPD